MFPVRYELNVCMLFRRNMGSVKYVILRRRCAGALVSNYGATNMASNQKKATPPPLKRQPDFQTHKWSSNK
jgi:hypothetical protein